MQAGMFYPVTTQQDLWFGYHKASVFDSDSPVAIEVKVSSFSGKKPT